MGIEWISAILGSECGRHKGLWLCYVGNITEGGAGVRGLTEESHEMVVRYSRSLTKKGGNSFQVPHDIWMLGA